MRIPALTTILLLLLVSDGSAQERSSGVHLLNAASSWPAAVERSLWRTPYTALAPEPPPPWSEVAAGRGACLRGALIGGGAGAVVSVGWLALNSEGALFEGPRERNFALIAVGAGALIGCALASG
jgi:hypothetical protein